MIACGLRDLLAAGHNHRLSVTLCREIKKDQFEAMGQQELGRLLAYLGVYAQSETELATALKMFKKHNNVQGRVIWSNA